MIASTVRATCPRRTTAPVHASARDASTEGSPYWVDPGTRQCYPVAYRAYRRAREAEETHPPRHRVLGPDVDHYLWRRGHDAAAAPEVEVLLTFRHEAPPRVRRLVVEILRAIRRGRPAGEAIRHVSRRFGLRRTRALGFVTACVLFERRLRLM